MARRASALDKKTQALQDIADYPFALYEFSGDQYVPLAHALALKNMAKQALKAKG